MVRRSIVQCKILLDDCIVCNDFKLIYEYVKKSLIATRGYRVVFTIFIGTVRYACLLVNNKNVMSIELKTLNVCRDVFNTVKSYMSLEDIEEYIEDYADI